MQQKQVKSMMLQTKANLLCRIQEITVLVYSATFGYSTMDIRQQFPFEKGWQRAFP